MKKLLGIAVASAVLASVAIAGDVEMSCCGGAKGKAAGGCGATSCTEALNKLNLTDIQQARVETLETSCRTAASTSERIAMMTAGLEKILTPAQFAQWKSDRNQAMKGGKCTMSTAPNKTS